MAAASPLRKRFLEDLQLAGFSPRTQQAYVRSVRLLSEHFGKSLRDVSDEDLRTYFLHIKNVKKWSRSTCTISLCAIKFFVQKTLARPWTSLEFVRPAPDTRLPVILSLDEVRRTLAAVRLLRFRVCLSTIYSCGLRLSEALHLEVGDIDAGRMFLHIRAAKGNRDRYVPLPQRTLLLLRQAWKAHRHPMDVTILLLNEIPGAGTVRRV
mgnify:CR=1 FL=1